MKAKSHENRANLSMSLGVGQCCILLHPQTTVFPEKWCTMEQWYRLYLPAKLALSWLRVIFRSRMWPSNNFVGKNGGSSTGMTDFFVKWEGRDMPASFSRVRLVVFFFLFFCWENMGDKIRKIILKSAKRRSNDPQFEGKGLATLRPVISLFMCNGRGLGPGLEVGPRLEKPGSPRGLLVLSLVVHGCWSQNGAVLFQFSFAIVVLSGASCSSSVVVLFVWLELPYKRCFARVSSLAVVVVVVLCLSWKLWISWGMEVVCVCLELKWERTGYARVLHMQAL